MVSGDGDAAQSWPYDHLIQVAMNGRNAASRLSVKSRSRPGLRHGQDSGEAFMRFLTIAVSVSALALATGAFAQNPTPRSAPPPAATGADLSQQDHQRRFTEDKIPYKPCPTSAVLADGRHVCLGCPTECGSHF
jgi:hypothetical protein